jgi:hypothetical protein
MRNVRARYAFIAACAAWLVSPDEAAAQRRRRITDLPPDPIVAATEWWGAYDRRFDPLRYKTLEADDIELRFWGGYGLVGTSGIFLRRTGGQWSVWRVHVQRCAAWLPRSVFDTLSEATEKRYLEHARRNCAQRTPPDSLPEAVPVTIDTLDATPVSPRADVADVWKELVDAGIATLPTSVHRSQVMTDGHTYVVQLRMGQEYRVSRIEQWHVVETPADKAIQSINAILTQRIGWAAGDKKR